MYILLPYNMLQIHKWSCSEIEKSKLSAGERLLGVQAKAASFP